MSKKVYAIVNRSDRPDFKYPYYVYETKFMEHASTAVSEAEYVDCYRTEELAKEAIKELQGGCNGIDYKKLGVELQQGLRELYNLCNKLAQ